jgi:hypothetical protein
MSLWDDLRGLNLYLAFSLLLLGNIDANFATPAFSKPQIQPTVGFF